MANRETGLGNLAQQIKEEFEGNFDAYSALSDEELAVRAGSGDAQATEFLLLKYKNFVRSKARAYFLVGADKEDLMQEGMIGLYKAVRDFKPEKNVHFCAFAELCVTRQIITAIKAATREKHKPLNSYVSLSKPVYDEESDRMLVDVIESRRIQNPEEIMMDNEEFVRLEAKMDEILSKFEKQVLELFLQGRPYAAIAQALDRDTKAIDNALQRVKNKLERYVGRR